jgi:hypothetical protein
MKNPSSERASDLLNHIEKDRGRNGNVVEVEPLKPRVAVSSSRRSLLISLEAEVSLEVGFLESV